MRVFDLGDRWAEYTKDSVNLANAMAVIDRGRGASLRSVASWLPDRVLHRLLMRGFGQIVATSGRMCGLLARHRDWAVRMDVTFHGQETRSMRRLARDSSYPVRLMVASLWKSKYVLLGLGKESGRVGTRARNRLGFRGPQIVVRGGHAYRRK